jgi:diguanylate cyclase (GGDEF)-like protein/PAS domain S-box-containing protein
MCTVVIHAQPAVDASTDAAQFPPSFWAQIAAASPEITLVLDHDHVVRFASDSMLTVTGIEPAICMGLHLARIIHRDDWDTVVRALERLRDGEPIAEVDCRTRFSDGDWHHVNVRGRLVAHPDGTWTVVAARDVTADRRNEALLARKLDLERVLELVQRRFIHVPTAEIDEALGWALREIGRFLGADRAYLLTYDLEHRTESMTHEWCAPSATPDLDTYQDVPFEAVPMTSDRALAGEVIAILDIEALDGTWSADREFLLGEGLRSILEFPIVIGGHPVGSLGFDWTSTQATWTNEDLTGLGMFASTFAQVLAKQRSANDLERTLQELRMGFESSPVPLMLVDPAGTILRVNDELCQLVGFGAGLLEGRPARELVAEPNRSDAEEWGSAVQSDVAHDAPLRTELVTGNGRRVWVDVFSRPVLDDQGRAAFHVLRLEDVTSVRLAEAAREESEARFATLVNNLPVPVMRVGRDGETLLANPAARDLLSFESAGRNPLAAEARAVMQTSRVTAVATGRPQTTTFEVRQGDATRFYEARFVPEQGDDGATRSLLMFATDLTERRSHEAELAHHATHDALTGLPNRRAFLEHLGDALEDLRVARTGIVATLFFDLDRFKVVNDSLGHGAGDQLLVAVGNRLREALRPTDLLARLGGDEFTVLLPHCRTAAEVEAIAEQLKDSLAEPVEVGLRRISVSCSIGVALATTGQESAVEMMQWADAAMYQAKEHGRNRVAMFDDALAAEVRGRLELDQRLRTAVDRMDFEVHLQPEVDLVTGRILGAEALLRWRTEHGLVSAAEFIGLAEDTGLIVPIGRWVLEQACAEAARWEVDFPERALTVRVNLSARQLDDADLADQVRDVLERTGLDPRRLCLEITETALMADAEASARLLQSLDALGVSLAVDDFGTGYSSLAYLKQFPVDVLKVDRSFVDGLPRDAEDAAIVSTIVNLAESLGMDVTAEGIETPEQATTLVEMGCTKGQGFLFARPMPIELFRKSLDES